MDDDCNADGDDIDDTLVIGATKIMCWFVRVKITAVRLTMCSWVEGRKLKEQSVLMNCFDMFMLAC